MELWDTEPVKVEPGWELSTPVQGILSRIPRSLLDRCATSMVSFKDMGPSAQYTPNHGYYLKGLVVLNGQMSESSVEYRDGDKVVPEFEFILIHEIGHGFDEAGGDLSLQPEWLGLSGWSEHPGPGQARITIKDVGAPVEGEWYFKDGSKFCRYYGMRNPWDDFADSFSFYVLGLKGFIPPEKLEYMDRVLAPLMRG